MKDNLTQLMFAFDCGSIPEDQADKCLKAIKAFAAELKKIDDKELRVSGLTFGSVDETRIVNKPLKKLHISELVLHNDGSGACPMLDKTATLMDDIGVRLTNTPEDERPSQIILTIVVFGRDNASKKFTYDHLRDMIAHQRDIYKWKFFLMTDFSINMEKLGIAEDDTILIKKSEDDWMKKPFEELSEKMIKHIREFKQ